MRKVSCEEVFGPVVTLTRTSSLEEAIKLANSTCYGLQAAYAVRELTEERLVVIQL